MGQPKTWQPKKNMATKKMCQCFGTLLSCKTALRLCTVPQKFENNKPFLSFLLWYRKNVEQFLESRKIVPQECTELKKSGLLLPYNIS